MKILFIGNSHTFFNDMPKQAADMLEQMTGESVDAVMLAYSYKELEWHAKSEYFAARFNILYGGYDYCVMQQAAHPFPGLETTTDNAVMLAGFCRTAGTTPVLIQTWAERDFPEHQAELSESNAKAAAAADALLAPVGSIWDKFRKDHPDLDLFHNDGEHAGLLGAYLEAMTIAMTICRDLGENGADISGVPAEKLSDDAIQFSDGSEIDYDAPRIIEDPAEAAVTLDEEKAAEVRKAVISFMSD